MTVAVTLDLPKRVIETAKRFSGVTQQTFEGVLADILEMTLPMLEDNAGLTPLSAGGYSGATSRK